MVFGAAGSAPGVVTASGVPPTKETFFFAGPPGVDAPSVATGGGRLVPAALGGGAGSLWAWKPRSIGAVARTCARTGLLHG